MFRNSTNGDGARLVRGLSAGRSEPHVPPFRAHDDAREPERRRRSSITYVYRLTDPELYPVPVHHDDGAGRRVLRRGRGGGAARLSRRAASCGRTTSGAITRSTLGNGAAQGAAGGEYPIVDHRPLEHPIFHALYDVPRCAANSVDRFLAGDRRPTSERGATSAEPHVRAIFDAKGHMMVLMTHNTDFGDAFERESDDRRDTSMRSRVRATRSASTCCCTR